MTSAEWPRFYRSAHVSGMVLDVRSKGAVVMPNMVYLKEHHPHSFLVLTTNGEGFRLRDFSSRSGKQGQIVREQMPPEWTTTRVLQLASAAGNHNIRVPERPIDDYAYWHDQTVKLNKCIATPPPPPPPPPIWAHR